MRATRRTHMIDIPEKWQPLKATESWIQFRELFDTAVNTLLEEARDELEALDAYGVVLRALSVATEVVFDPNPDYPVFVRMDTPARNIAGDNPDAEYDVTTIDGRDSYRLTGNRGSVTYLGFQVLGGKGMSPRHPVTYIKDEHIQTDSDGNFELILSTEMPRTGGQWIKITEDASAIVVRQYIGNRNTEKLADYAIERIAGIQENSTIGDAQIAEKLISTAWTMVKLALIYRDIPGLLEKPNQLTSMSSEQAGAADSTPDNLYMIGVYDIGPEQALIIDVQPPKTRYWNFTVENIWHECIDYLHRPASITNASVKLRTDKTARFVISHQKPESMSEDVNWLDTSGRKRGFMILRWLDCPEVAQPAVQLVSLHEDFNGI
jgi:hypothetical protein